MLAGLLCLLLIGVYLCYLLATYDRQLRLVEMTVEYPRTSSYMLRTLVLKSFLNRTIGLLNHIDLPRGQALLLMNTKSVHTRGMLFAIDLIALSASFKVLAIERDVAPGGGPRGLHNETKHIVEVAANTAQLFCCEGDTLVVTQGDGRVVI